MIPNLPNHVRHPQHKLIRTRCVMWSCRMLTASNMSLQSPQMKMLDIKAAELQC
jgi:hypothetical protein